MLLDGLLSALAITQAIIVTLRAGSRLVLTNDSQDYFDDREQVDLPLILPPSLDEDDDKTNAATPSLFDLTCAFRHGVKLGLRLDEFDTKSTRIDEHEHEHPFYRVIDCSSLIHQPQSSTEPYRMSLVPAVVSRDENQAEEGGEDDILFSVNNSHEAQEDVILAIEYNARNDHSDENMRTRKYATVKSDSVSETYSSSSSYYSEALATEYALNSQQVATITTYLPDCFADLRSFFGIDTHAFATAFLERPFCSFQSNSKGAARIGGVFFLTSDGQYICKTIKRDELITLLRMMPRYRGYMQAQGHSSLLTRVCGLFEISFNKQAPQYLVIMNSIFPAAADIEERFDLKGSTVGRRVTDKELVRLGGRRRAVLKDLNLVDEATRMVHANNDMSDDGDFDEATQQRKQQQPQQSSRGLHVGTETKQALLQQLRSDVQLLEECGVIDYSLLVGVSSSVKHSSSKSGRRREKLISLLLNRPRHPNSSGVEAGPLAAVPGTRKSASVTYYFGVIDFLQPFNTKKQWEYRAKAIRYAGAPATYSCVPPSLYARRFLDFIDQHVT